MKIALSVGSKSKPVDLSKYQNKGFVELKKAHETEYRRWLNEIHSAK